MIRPTPREMAGAYTLVERMAKALEDGRTTSLMPAVEAAALRTLLAATKPSTDDVIVTVFEHQDGTPAERAIKTVRALMGYPVANEPQPGEDP